MGEAEFQDVLGVRARGRGAQLNPGNRFEDVRLHVLGEHMDEIAAEMPDGRRVVTQVFSDRSKTMINAVDSPDLPFGWTVNPYRGCEHGCIYCYARPGHEYLGLSCGLDFETKITAKFDAPEMLASELDKKSWNGETVVFSGVTDCYQPIEAKLRITRRCLDVCAERAQPVSIVTKNALVVRDADILGELAKFGASHVAISITTLDNRLASAMEPRASAPRERLRAIRELTAAGVPVQVMTAPIIPALNESEIPALLEAAKEAGAVGAGYTMLRLPHQIKALFLDWLSREFPQRAAHVEAALRDVREGELYRAEFGSRMRGTGPRADQIATMFKVFRRKHGLDRVWTGLNSGEFLRRKKQRLEKGQMGLFG
jgi:DNA repair photolyase